MTDGILLVQRDVKVMKGEARVSGNDAFGNSQGRRAVSYLDFNTTVTGYVGGGTKEQNIDFHNRAFAYISCNYFMAFAIGLEAEA